MNVRQYVCSVLVVSCLLLCPPIFAAQDIRCSSSSSTINIQSTVENAFVDFLSSKYDNFQITRVYSRDGNSDPFITDKLEKAAFVGVRCMDARTLYFQATTDKTSTHMGYAILIYENDAAAERASKILANEGWFKETHILTRYKSSLLYNKILILFTESSADPVATEFLQTNFSQLEKSGEKGDTTSE